MVVKMLMLKMTVLLLNFKLAVNAAGWFQSLNASVALLQKPGN